MNGHDPRGASAGAGAGSQSALRTANTRRVVSSLRSSGPLTQASIARVTGLSTATVSNIVKALTAQGVLRTSPTTSSGRRATLVELGNIHTNRYVAGIDFGRRHVRVIVADAARDVVAEGERSLPVGHSADQGISTANELLDSLLEHAGATRDELVACGAGIPGPIAATSGRISHGAILPAWVGIDLAGHLESRLGMVVHVDNDANLGALAEVTWGPYADVAHLVYLKVATGIGAGLILSGEVYRGSTGVTGELGHAPVTEYGPLCRCGNRGCLETLASTAVMTALLPVEPGQGQEPSGTSELIRRVRRGDPATLRVVDDAATAVGKVLAGVVNLLGPQVVVIGGPLAELGDAYLEPVRRGVLRYAAPIASESVTLAASTLGDRAGALGACSLAYQRAGSAIWESRIETASMQNLNV